jgi:signal transduction histidine kinase
MPRNPLDVVQDPDRLEALRETGLLDSQMEEEFDRLTRLASRLLGVPATFFSLVDEDRDFYKSCFGFDEPLASERQIEGVTFCHFSLVSDGALVIPDTRADPVYRTVPTVESMGVAAYLGVPIRAPGGEALGSFCAIDFEPHDWSQLETDIMKELAKSAEREVALRHWMRSQTEMMEAERVARQDLERVMESRSRLIRGFSHDMKNPLGAADGFLVLLQDEIVGPLLPRQKETIVRIRLSVGASIGLVDDLGEIARAEAGQLEIKREPLDVGELVREVTEEYRAQAEANGLELLSKIQGAFPTIASDPARIRQILGNLISNAVKYTPAGRVTVSIELRPGDGLHANSDVIAIDVSDTGSGIPNEKLHLVFEEFSRLDPQAADGAGLGLAISHRIAEALGGRITVESEVGVGSTFTLWLPYLEGKPSLNGWQETADP